MGCVNDSSKGDGDNHIENSGEVCVNGGGNNEGKLHDVARRQEAIRIFLTYSDDSGAVVGSKELRRRYSEVT